MFLNKNISLLFVLSTAVFYSQEKTIKKDTLNINELDEVVITATRTVRQLSTLPLPVTLITKKQVDQTGKTRLKDILLEQTGINFVTDASGFTGVQMQGLSAEYTMILIDGVPLIGRSSGNLDLNRITINNIKQIEIVKGPSSSLYGSEALGGVINIITEKPKKDTLNGNIGYFVKVGAKEELDINSNFLYKKNNLGIVAGINLNSSNGYDLSPETAFKTTEAHQNYTGNLQLNYDFSKNVNLSISQRYFYEEQNENNIQKDWNSNVDLKQTINNFDINYTFYATKFNTESVFNGDESVYNQTLLRPEIRISKKLNNSILSTGFGVNFDALNRTFFDKNETFNSKYIFAQYDFHPTEKLNTVIGARFDNHNKYKSAFSPKISSTYKINNWLKTKGSVGFGFKAPDFRQLFFNFNNSAAGYVVLGTRTLHELYGNEPNVQAITKDLNPENSIGYNFGFDIKPFSKLKIHVNGFRNNIKDLINTVSLQGGLPNLNPTTTVFYYENRNEVFTQGIELDVNYKINDNFRFIGGYQFMEAKDKEEIEKVKSGTIYFRKTATSSAEVLQISNYYGLANRSKHTANAKLFYQNLTHNFSANIRALYRSKYALYDTNNSQNIIDKYDDFVASNTLINVAIEKTFLGLMNLQLGIDNLFNQKGLENKNTFQNNDAVLLLGRSFYTRMRINF